MIFPPTSYLENVLHMFPSFIIAISSLLTGVVHGRWKWIEGKSDPNIETVCLLPHIFRVKPRVTINKQNMKYWKFTLPLFSNDSLLSEWHNYSNPGPSARQANACSIEKDTISYHCNHWVNISLYCINLMTINIICERILLTSIPLLKWPCYSGKCVYIITSFAIKLTPCRELFKLKPFRTSYFTYELWLTILGTLVFSTHEQ